MVFHSDFQFLPLPTPVVCYFILYYCFWPSTIPHSGHLLLFLPFLPFVTWLPSSSPALLMTPCWMFPEKELPQNFLKRGPSSAVWHPLEPEQRGYGTKSLRRVVERRKITFMINDGLGRWIVVRDPFETNQLWTAQRNTPRSIKRLPPVRISSFSTVGRYGWPALLLRMGPVFCFLFFCFFFH